MISYLTVNNNLIWQCSVTTDLLHIRCIRFVAADSCDRKGVFDRLNRCEKQSQHKVMFSADRYAYQLNRDSLSVSKCTESK